MEKAQLQIEVDRSLEVLHNGGVLIYPTDTVWGVGCDATSAEAVDKVFELKNRPEHKSMIILVKDWAMLESYVKKIPEGLQSFLEEQNRPTTVIYEQPIGLAVNVIAQTGTVAVRIAETPFLQSLLTAFGKPIVSTSANYSGEPTAAHYDEINPLLLDKADYVVNLSREAVEAKSSQIVLMKSDGRVEYLRK